MTTSTTPQCSLGRNSVTSRRSPSSCANAAVVAEAVPSRAESLVGSSCEEFQASETGRQSLRKRTDCRSLGVLQPWAMSGSRGEWGLPPDMALAVSPIGEIGKCYSGSYPFISPAAFNAFWKIVCSPRMISSSSPATAVPGSMPSSCSRLAMIRSCAASGRLNAIG
jgi:hypothetical protein